MGFLMGILIGLASSLMVARALIWQQGRGRDELDCERLVAAEEARREQLRGRLAACLDPGSGAAPESEITAAESGADQSGPASPATAFADTGPEPPPRSGLADRPRAPADVPRTATPPKVDSPPPQPRPTVSRSTSQSGGSATGSDDLRKIEGIGPKIAGLLNADGIGTFDSLAAAEVTRLQRVLDDAGNRYRLADPSTWPEQAALAAAGDWDGLEKLQEALKGGRRV